RLETRQGTSVARQAQQEASSERVHVAALARPKLFGPLDCVLRLATGIHSVIAVFSLAFKKQAPMSAERARPERMRRRGMPSPTGMHGRDVIPERREGIVPSAQRVFPHHG